MKKFIALLCMTLSLTLAFAASNGVKAVEVGSDVYNAVKSLYISQGHALPSTTGPWSENEVKLMLNKLDKEKLTTSEKKPMTMWLASWNTMTISSASISMQT